MELQELDQIVRQSLVSAFRLETLPRYLTLTDQEAAEYGEWQAGRRAPLPTPETSSWLARIQSTVADGYRWYRVHIMDHPLSDYSQFELYGYQANARAGEDIYIADRHAHRDLDGLRQDFWLIDDEIAVVMHYDDDGRFLRPERAADASPYRQMRDTALHHAVTLADYLTHAGLWPTA